jgi:hypothetical protein
MGWVPKFIQLPNADNVRLEAWYPVHVLELTVVLVIHGEQYRPMATDVDDGSIAEPHLAGDALV